MNTRTIINLLFLALLSVVSTNVSAQRTVRKSNNKNTNVSHSALIVNAYTDSIKAYRARLDSILAERDSAQTDTEDAKGDKRFRMFAPTTFYADIAGKMLELYKEEPTAEEKALMDLYLKRPDLVVTTSKDLAMYSTANEEENDALAPVPIVISDQVNTVLPIEKAEEDISNQKIDLYVSKPKFWKFNGEYYLQFMQNYLTENWYKSGSNNYSMLGSATLQYNFNNKQKVKWENKLEMKLGMMTSESDTINKFKSTEDLIRLTSKFGLQAHKNWYYTAQLIANTQFTQGRKDNKDKVFSDFMSPFNLNVSLGMDYTIKTKNEKLIGSAHIAPIAYNLKYVDRLELGKSFGLEEDHHSLSDFGSQFTVDLEWKPWSMLKWQLRMYGYTTYHKFEFECENTISFKFNRYISANVFLYPRFDDSTERLDGFSYWQFKEYLSLGFSYSM